MNKLIALGLVLCTCITLYAQQTIQWKGGAPGAEFNWDNPKNWTPNRIPSADDIVVIPDCSTKGGFYPELTKTTGPIAHLRVESGALLTIQPGVQLAIDGCSTFHDGIALFGTIRNAGRISINNVGVDEVYAPKGHTLYNGIALKAPADANGHLARQ